MSDVPTISELTNVFGNILNVFLPFLGLVAFIMLLIGGFTLLTSAGNQEGVKKGQHLISYAIGGLILAILSWIILQTIATLTGANVTQFKLGF